MTKFKIQFKESDHSYIAGKRKMKGVNTFLGSFGFHFDSDFWLAYKAFQPNIPNFSKLYFVNGFNYEDKTPSSELLIATFEQQLEDLGFDLAEEIAKVQDSWTLSSTNGTKFHEEQEALAYSDGFALNAFDGKKYETQPKPKINKGFNNASFTDPFKQIKDGAHMELLCFSEELGICGQADMVFFETIDGVRYFDLDDWKGLALDTEIPTPSGWTTMGELERGQEVFDGNGEITKIENVSEIHLNPCYKITFDTKEEIVADHEHRWVVEKALWGKYKNVEMTTEEMYDYICSGENKSVRIPCTSIKMRDVNLPLDPYILGLWLADGNRTCGTITCDNDDIWEEISDRGFKVSTNHNKDYEDKAESRTIYGIRKHLVDLNVLGNKHIPEIYMRSSESQRLDLLRGYMDGDGHFHRKRRRCVMETTSLQQSNDVKELCASLGFKPVVFESDSKGFGKIVHVYHVTFSPNTNPFLVRNKDYDIVFDSGRGKKNRVRKITSIEKIETVETRCIAVESNDKTYLTTRAYIKTHNTNKKKPKYKSSKKYLQHPLSHLYDCTYAKYWLQTSMYAYLLSLQGFTPRNLGFSHITNYDVSTRDVNKLTYLGQECKDITEMYLDHLTYTP